MRIFLRLSCVSVLSPFQYASFFVNTGISSSSGDLSILAVGNRYNGSAARSFTLVQLTDSESNSARRTWNLGSLVYPVVIVMLGLVGQVIPAADQGFPVVWIDLLDDGYELFSWVRTSGAACIDLITTAVSPHSEDLSSLLLDNE